MEFQEEAEAVKKQVAAMADELKEIEEKEAIVREEVTAIMMQIPNMIDPSVPIGKDDSENVELKKIRRTDCSGLCDSLSYRDYGILSGN